MCQDIHQTISMSQILNAVKSQYAVLFSQSNQKSVPVLVVTLCPLWCNSLSPNQTRSNHWHQQFFFSSLPLTRHRHIRNQGTLFFVNNAKNHGKLKNIAVAELLHPSRSVSNQQASRCRLSTPSIMCYVLTTIKQTPKTPATVSTHSWSAMWHWLLGRYITVNNRYKASEVTTGSFRAEI